MISGIHFTLGPGTKMSDPFVYVVAWALNYEPLTKKGPILQIPVRKLGAHTSGKVPLPGA